MPKVKTGLEPWTGRTFYIYGVPGLTMVKTCEELPEARCPCGGSLYISEYESFSFGHNVSVKLICRDCGHNYIAITR